MGRIAITTLLLVSVAYATVFTPRAPERVPNWGPVIRIEEYRAVASTGYGDTIGRDPFLPACAHTNDPIPFYTPNPTLHGDSDVVVNFLVGTDGKVYSGFTLRGSGLDPDSQATFRAMEKWRFHPGTCNGIPTDSEGIVVFRPR